jgi:hypothetical protein
LEGEIVATNLGKSKNTGESAKSLDAAAKIVIVKAAEWDRSTGVALESVSSQFAAMATVYDNLFKHILPDMFKWQEAIAASQQHMLLRIANVLDGLMPLNGLVESTQALAVPNFAESIQEATAFNFPCFVPSAVDRRPPRLDEIDPQILRYPLSQADRRVKPEERRGLRLRDVPPPVLQYIYDTMQNEDVKNHPVLSVIFSLPFVEVVSWAIKEMERGGSYSALYVVNFGASARVEQPPAPAQEIAPPRPPRTGRRPDYDFETMARAVIAWRVLQAQPRQATDLDADDMLDDAPAKRMTKIEFLANQFNDGDVNELAVSTRKFDYWTQQFDKGAWEIPKRHKKRYEKLKPRKKEL